MFREDCFEFETEFRNRAVGRRFSACPVSRQVVLSILATCLLVPSLVGRVCPAQSIGSDRNGGGNVDPQAVSNPSIRIKPLDLGGPSTQRKQYRLQVRPVSGRPREVQLAVSGFGPREQLTLANGNSDDDSWKRLFVVSVASAGTSDPPGMLGDYRFEKGELVFEPRFPLRPGTQYRAVLHLGTLHAAAGEPAALVGWSITVPARESAPRTRVVNVYPSRDVLPENLLKFYIHFSAPMSRGEAYQRIRLTDAAGAKVEYPFLELGEELWDPTGTRFTLFFDPGRIKRGLRPREELGPAIEAGKSYTLEIDGGWPDALGQPMEESFQKPFHVIAPDETQPDPDKWRLSVPQAHTQAPLVVQFTEPLDHAMLQGVLVVLDESRQRVEGDVAVEADETRWLFRPASPWRSGRFELVVDTTLEDAAGNSIGRPFEVDVFHPIERRIRAKTVSIPFRIPAADQGR